MLSGCKVPHSFRHASTSRRCSLRLKWLSSLPDVLIDSSSLQKPIQLQRILVIIPVDFRSRFLRRNLTLAFIFAVSLLLVSPLSQVRAHPHSMKHLYCDLSHHRPISGHRCSPRNHDCSSASGPQTPTRYDPKFHRPEQRYYGPNQSRQLSITRALLSV